MPGFGTIIGLPRQHETKAEADDRRRNQDDGERHDQAQDERLPARSAEGDRERWTRAGLDGRQLSTRSSHRRR
jgi:hypothetical protein